MHRNDMMIQFETNNCNKLLVSCRVLLEDIMKITLLPIADHLKLLIAFHVGFKLDGI